MQCHPASTRASVRRPPTRARYPTLGANRATPASLCPAVIAGWQVRVLRWRLPADCLRPRRAVRAALDRPLLRPFPSSSRVLLVIPSLAVRSGRRGRFHSLRGRLDSKTRVVAGAGAVSRSDGGGRGHARVGLTPCGDADVPGIRGPNQAVTGRMPPEMAPTPSGRTNDDGGHSGQLLQDHRRAGGSPDRRPGLRTHRGQGARSTSRPATRSTTLRATKPRTSTGLRDTYPVYHVSELNIAELRPRTPPTSSDRAIEAQNTEFAEQLKVRGEAPREPDEAERAALVVPKEIGKVPHDILRGQRGRAPARPGQLRACRRLAGGRVQEEVGRGGRGSRQVLATVGVDATGSKPRRLSAPDSRGGSCRCSSGRWPQGRAARTAAASRPPRRPHAQGRAASCTSAAARRGRRSVP